MSIILGYNVFTWVISKRFAVTAGILSAVYHFRPHWGMGGLGIVTQPLCRVEILLTIINF